jgi:hypothetical protein
LFTLGSILEYYKSTFFLGKSYVFMTNKYVHIWAFFSQSSSGRSARMKFTLSQIKLRINRRQRDADLIRISGGKRLDRGAHVERKLPMEVLSP